MTARANRARKRRAQKRLGQWTRLHTRWMVGWRQPPDPRVWWVVVG